MTCRKGKFKEAIHLVNEGAPFMIGMPCIELTSFFEDGILYGIYQFSLPSGRTNRIKIPSALVEFESEKVPEIAINGQIIDESIVDMPIDEIIDSGAPEEVLEGNLEEDTICKFIKPNGERCKLNAVANGYCFIKSHREENDAGNSRK